MEAASEVKPDLIFIFDVLPEESRDTMLSWWSIDIAALRDAGVDYIGVMSFHPQTMEEQRVDLEQAMDHLNTAYASIAAQAGKDRVIYRVWTSTWDTHHNPLPKEEMSYVLERMKEMEPFNMGYIPHNTMVSEYGIFEGL